MRQALVTVLLSLAGSLACDRPLAEPPAVELVGRCFAPVIIDESGNARAWPQGSPYWYTPKRLAFQRDSVHGLHARAVDGFGSERQPFLAATGENRVTELGDSIQFAYDNGFHGVTFHLKLGPTYAAGRLTEITDVGNSGAPMDSVRLDPVSCD